MRVAMIGTGYVGVVSGACFADFGHDVICVDKDPSKIERLEREEIPIFGRGPTIWWPRTSAAAVSASPFVAVLGVA